MPIGYSAAFLLADTGANWLFPLLTLWLPLLAIFYLLILRPQMREQTRRQEMLAGVKKNDRVVAAGGVYGTVTNVHREADEVTIRVDETTNTKLRVTFSSIVRVLGEETGEKK